MVDGVTSIFFFFFLSPSAFETLLLCVVCLATLRDGYRLIYLFLFFFLVTPVTRHVHLSYVKGIRDKCVLALYTGIKKKHKTTVKLPFSFQDKNNNKIIFKKLLLCQ